MEKEPIMWPYCSQYVTDFAHLEVFLNALLVFSIWLNLKKICDVITLVLNYWNIFEATKKRIIFSN